MKAVLKSTGLSKCYYYYHVGFRMEQDGDESWFPGFSAFPEVKSDILSWMDHNDIPNIIWNNSVEVYSEEDATLLYMRYQ